ncbi:hypothetical protein [Streptomyces sp. NPDC001985]|uniref:hypothetical protein n=1 Tax=Streptomyces sp. NPDC001985 TaxID=3154406 RepID=UPI00331A6BEE
MSDPGGSPERDRTPPPPRPDRVVGELRSFGPGVPASTGSPAVARTAATAAEVWRGADRVAERRRARRRRRVLMAVVVPAVLALLAWQRYGGTAAVDAVSVRSAVASLGCDGTADIVGLVDTNGRPGTLVYRWVRSDGTESGRLRERVTRGQKQARLRLRWSFRGQGEHRAGAELRIVSPSSHRAGTRFVYHCPPPMSSY